MNILFDVARAVRHEDDTPVPITRKRTSALVFNPNDCSFTLYVGLRHDYDRDAAVRRLKSRASWLIHGAMRLSGHPVRRGRWSGAWDRFTWRST